jgi:acyl carrier protein
MVPSVFVTIPRIPRTVNGKLDRQALPAPTERPHLSVGYVAPRSGPEATVAAVWAEVLGLERVGAADDFFELGGNSLSLMRVLWRLEEEFEAQVPIEQFFATPTVAALALLVGAAGAPVP